MSLRRILILLGKEFSAGSRNFIFIFAIVVPVVITLVVTLLFGNLFLGQPRLGLADEGNSEIMAEADALEGVSVRTFDSEMSLKEAVENGVVEVGMLLPAGFDELLGGEAAAPLRVYVFGESLLRNRAILATTIASLIRDLSGETAPVTIATTLVGEDANIPWEERLLPFIVMITILIGGIMVPATSLVDEKQKRTLKALTVTPSSLGEVYFAKGLLGSILSIIMAFVILAMNRALGDQIALLLGTLLMGAIMAAAFGVLLGAFLKDVNTLFATIKGMGIFLYAPALVYLFPAIPEWVAQIFPTYYLIQPVMEIVQEGAGPADVAFELAVLAGLIVLMIVGIVLVSRRVEQIEV